ncbi:MAG: hypothetical protein M3552_03200 [Planctomycetota bacterium]|nr:hypothetical protein [Planctomycetaceae bacterium]MDQ3329653.1 hypothetical protein [Planctomycetota bacterium]
MILEPFQPDAEAPAPLRETAAALAERCAQHRENQEAFIGEKNAVAALAETDPAAIFAGDHMRQLNGREVELLHERKLLVVALGANAGDVDAAHDGLRRKALAELEKLRHDLAAEIRGHGFESDLQSTAMIDRLVSVHPDVRQLHTRAYHDFAGNGGHQYRESCRAEITRIDAQLDGLRRLALQSVTTAVPPEPTPPPRPTAGFERREFTTLAHASPFAPPMPTIGQNNLPVADFGAHTGRPLTVS